MYSKPYMKKAMNYFQKVAQLNSDLYFDIDLSQLTYFQVHMLMYIDDKLLFYSLQETIMMVVLLIVCSVQAGMFLIVLGGSDVDYLGVIGIPFSLPSKNPYRILVLIAINVFKVYTEISEWCMFLQCFGACIAIYGISRDFERHFQQLRNSQCGFGKVA
jgi:cobalamin synthase